MRARAQARRGGRTPRGRRSSRRARGSPPAHARPAPVRGGTTRPAPGPSGTSTVPSGCSPSRTSRVATSMLGDRHPHGAELGAAGAGRGLACSRAAGLTDAALTPSGSELDRRRRAVTPHDQTRGAGKCQRRRQDPPGGARSCSRARLIGRLAPGSAERRSARTGKAQQPEASQPVPPSRRGAGRSQGARWGPGCPHRVARAEPGLPGPRAAGASGWRSASRRRRRDARGPVGPAQLGPGDRVGVQRDRAVAGQHPALDGGAGLQGDGRQRDHVPTKVVAVPSVAELPTCQ